MHYIFITLGFYITLVGLVVFGQSLRAAPLFATDDAGIVSQGQCQIELGQSQYRGSSSAVNVTPSCNFGQELELAVALDWQQGQSSYALQLKKPFLELYDEKLTAAASLQWQPAQAQQLQQWQFNLPLSYVAAEKIQFDFNLGLQRESNRHDQHWGIASHYLFDSAHQVSLELFKHDDTHTQAQTVYQYQVIPDQVGLFVSFGQALKSSQSSWFGLGLSWAPTR